MNQTPCRNLVLILGDQLDEDSAAFDGLDPAQDVVLMIEAREECTHVWSHKARTVLFLSAMRHFAHTLRARGWRVAYRALDVEADESLAVGLQAAIRIYDPQSVIGVEPGDMRVRRHIQDALKSIANFLDETRANGQKLFIDWREDRHFLCSLPQFRRWAGQSSSLRMEFFYRSMRQQYKVLLDGGKPTGGQWNFDAENRKGFGKAGPQDVPRPPVFEPDAITREVMALVEQQFAGHPGELHRFNWPVTREQALLALNDFIDKRLADFGKHQDAMCIGLDFGWHALLSSSLNLKLLNPLEVVHAAEQAYRKRDLDLASVEGFIRQVLGWREFIRGVYFLDMPELKEANHFGHTNPLPAWYWTGNTRMNCMRQCINQTLANGYSHHIQRLMVTGMFGVTAQISPQALCDWYLAVYVDAVEWVELPNTAGMALFANGGRFTSKPYVASGAYVKRMSNYCSGCRYEPETRSGPNACPMTTLYWNFLDQNEAAFAGNPRTALMVRHLQRMTPVERAQVRHQAQSMLADLDAL
ncbi:MAG TPA: cryptochrome/photolyase family protein [Polaromonas sp.]|uniref:cryptochrome/photolyase family protein n=1 Tax=Polaromonas sp. TaxID=1869339 RepID=UPI002D3BFAFD|nr:cryptochrome/photolyase family protein [Polaromonas sp.]HYW56030.1 cryptochrome/photolyase family protein [Polaromonas sp.]